MVLAPEDVIKRTFPSTHLRRGYEENPVDDFMDEVVVELRRLNAEIDELRAGSGDDDTGDRGSAAAAIPGVDGADGAEAVSDEERARYESELAELRERLDGAAGGTDRADVEGRDAELASLREQLATAENAATEAVERAERAEQALNEAGTAVADDAGAAAAERGTSAASVLTRAQQLHDEMVAEGEATRSQLREEAEQYRERVVGEADARSTELVATGQTRHDELVAEGEGTRTRVLGETETAKAAVLADLARQRGDLETRIRELGDYESQYRGRLKDWVGTQLAALDEGVGLGMPSRVDDGEPAAGPAGRSRLQQEPEPVADDVPDDDHPAASTAPESAPSTGEPDTPVGDPGRVRPGN